MQIEAGGDPLDRSEVARDLIRRLDYWYDLSRVARNRDPECTLAGSE